MDRCIDVTFMRQPEGFENVAHRGGNEAAPQPRDQAPGGHTSAQPGDSPSQSPTPVQQPGEARSSRPMMPFPSLRTVSRSPDDGHSCGRGGCPTAEDRDTRYGIRIAALPQKDAKAVRCRQDYLRQKEASLFAEFQRITESFVVISGLLESIDVFSAARDAGFTIAHSVQSSLLLVLGCLGTVITSLTFLPGAFSFASEVKKCTVEHPNGRESAVSTWTRSSPSINMPTGADGGSVDAAVHGQEVLPSTDAHIQLQEDWLRRVQTKVAYLNALLTRGST